jgi:hypothetical protein
MNKRAVRLLLGLPGARSLGSKLPLSLETRVTFALGPKPMYMYGVYSAAWLAKRLGLAGISVFEFGVAGGNGLVALESHAEEVSRHFGISIDVFGFDTGTGLPPATDYRDMPYKWDSGFFVMDVERLKARLKTARLILGDVAKTVAGFLAEIKHPVGFVSYDMDYYSSTRNSLQMWDWPTETRLPRVWCYADDVEGLNEYVGTLCAIREFNLDHPNMKLCPMHLFRNTQQCPAGWHDRMYMLHDFRHPLYCKSIWALKDLKIKEERIQLKSGVVDTPKGGIRISA